MDSSTINFISQVLSKNRYQVVNLTMFLAFDSSIVNLQRRELLLNEFMSLSISALTISFNPSSSPARYQYPHYEKSTYLVTNSITISTNDRCGKLAEKNSQWVKSHECSPNHTKGPARCFPKLRYKVYRHGILRDIAQRHLLFMHGVI